jgi:hypothetical protein
MHHKIDRATSIKISQELLRQGVIKPPNFIHETGGSEFICRRCHDSKHGITHTQIKYHRNKLQTRLHKGVKKEEYLAYARQWQREHLF